MSLAMNAAVLIFGSLLLISANWEHIIGAPSTMPTNSVGGIGGGDATIGHSFQKVEYLRRLETSSQPSPATTPNPTPRPQTATTTKPTSSPATTPNPTPRPQTATTTKPTSSPRTSRPTSSPRTSRPTSNPITQKPTRNPITQRPTKNPIAAPTDRPTMSPTAKPTLSTPLEPLVLANASYFNFNTTEGSQFGPSAWEQVDVSNSYWSEFGFDTNQCNDRRVMQSPIDVCTAPERHCLEYHETRPNVRYLSFCWRFSIALLEYIFSRSPSLYLLREATSHLLISTCRSKFCPTNSTFALLDG
jgi:hypothetical protein